MKGCLLFAGPALLALGLLLVASGLYDTSIASTAEDADVAALRARNDAHVRVASVDLDWKERVVATYEGVNDVAFWDRDPRALLEASDPRDLAREESLHAFARLTLAAPLEGRKLYLYKAYRKDERGERIQGSESDVGTLMYAPLEETGDSVWVATEPVASVESPEANAARARAVHEGEVQRLHEVISDAGLDRAYAAGHGGRVIPRDAVVLEVKPRPRARRVETWAPAVMKDPTASRTVYVALDGTPESPPAAPLQGVYYRLPYSELGPLTNFLTDRRRLTPGERAGVLFVGTPAQYQARMGWQRVSRTGLWMCAAGVALTALLVVAARGKR